MLHKKIHIYFYIIIIILNILSYLFFNNLDKVDIYIYILSFIICICYVISLVYLFKTQGLLSLTTIFWICLWIFGVSRLFLFVLGIFNFMNEQYSILGSFYWENNITVQVLNYYLIFMTIFSNLAIFSNLKESSGGKDNTADIWLVNRSNPFISFRKYIYAVFYISAPIVVVFYLLQAVKVSQLGYTSIYVQGISNQLSFGPIFSIARFAFTVSFYSICSFERREKQFNVSSIVYLCITAIPLLQGSRAIFIVSLLTILFLRYRIFGKEIHFRWILIGILVSIPILVMIAYARNNIQITPISILTSYKKFIIDLSSSFNVPAYYLQHKSELSNNKYPYVFESIVRVYQYIFNNNVFKMGQSKEMIQIRFNLGHQITYNISHAYYLGGSNVASNFIAEMSEFGLIGVGLFSFVVSKIIIFFEKQIYNGNAYFSYMSVELCRWIFLMPRGETFYDTYNLIKYGSIYMLVFAFNILVNVKFKKRENNYGL